MNWREVTEAVPELAAKVQARFEAHGLAFLATVRKDGSPRVSGIETLFGEGDLWIGSMPDSFKAKDLLRDPRFAMHAASADKMVRDGDAKLSGLAVHVEDEATFERYRKASGGAIGLTLGGFHLFRIDVKEMSHLEGAGDHLNIEWWSESGGYRQKDRY